MREIPEIPEEIRNFVRTVLIAPVLGSTYDPMDWFRAGGWYMDAMATLVLTLPDDDLALAQILDSMRSGIFYESETVARNVLRFGLSMNESATFMIANSKAESFLLHARVLVQASARVRCGVCDKPMGDAPGMCHGLPDHLVPKPSAADFYAAVLKLTFLTLCWLPRLTWKLIKARLKERKS